jgi:hypothetical protein
MVFGLYQGILQRAIPALVRRSVQREIRRLQSRASSSVQCVVGTIHAPIPFESPILARPAVVARYRRSGTNARDAMRAIDFVLDTDSGPVEVRAATAFLDAQPRGEVRRSEDRSATFKEISVGPGDRVEVTGFVREEPDPAVDASAPGRGERLKRVLCGTPEVPLMIRPVEAKRT